VAARLTEIVGRRGTPAQVHVTVESVAQATLVERSDPDGRVQGHALYASVSFELDCEAAWVAQAIRTAVESRAIHQLDFEQLSALQLCNFLPLDADGADETVLWWDSPLQLLDFAGDRSPLIRTTTSVFGHTAHRSQQCQCACSEAAALLAHER
jgi:hypothetical protein